PLRPAVHANFPVDRLIWARFEKFCRHSIRQHADRFCPARNRFHHSTMTAGANIKSSFTQSAAQLKRFLVVRILFARTRTSEYRDDPFAHFSRTTLFPIPANFYFLFSFFSLPHCALTQHAAPPASYSSIIAMLNAS